MIKTLISVGYFTSLAALNTAAPTVSHVANNDLAVRWDAPLPDDCYYPDYMAPPFWTGGSDESANNYCVSRWKDGLLITGLTTFTKDKVVNGLQVTYSDGSKSSVYGKSEGDQDTGTWDMTDAIKLARMWGNGNGQRLGQIEVQTQSGKDVKIGNGRTDDDGAQNSEAGGGLLMGLIIATMPDESAILRAGFLFMKGQITGAVSADFVFDQDLATLNAQQTGISTSLLGEGYFTNDRNSSATCTFSNTVTRTNSRTVTQTNQHQVGYSFSFSVTADILDFAKIEESHTLSYQYTHIDTDATTTSEDIALRWDNTNLIVAPGKTIYCKASVVTGKFDGGYTSTIIVTINGGAQFSFKSRGQLDLVGWASVDSECNDVDTPPPGVPQLPEQ
ncbi:hypothetical protein BDV96DRAFT_605749 [Lophiotrema nucula]|uniref:Jacalin-type lectin domain-containing protein n=1 Tax=Lophiotrema nucula TaxID=690887 RepID=A0A6A5YMQ5_9PLEO|nr:hypothetical protein BDV96DRAFT_605749 [Lophiotrema nucula]